MDENETKQNINKPSKEQQEKAAYEMAQFFLSLYKQRKQVKEGENEA
jgi:hypothetical protein